jgi:hypothetical protein
VIGLGSLAAGGAAATGTGAFTAAQIQDRDANITVNGDDEALIQLIPGSTDDYGGDGTVEENRVGYTDNDELYISFDDSDSGQSTANNGTGTGINPNSYYQIGSVNDTQLTELRDGIDTSNFDGPNPLDSTLASTTSVAQDPAFTIQNASDNTRLIELSYDDETTPNPALATGLLGMFGPDATGNFSEGGAAVLALDVASNEVVSDQTTAELAPGEVAHVALFVEVGAVDEDGQNDDFKGSLRINAGQKARREDTV